MTSTPAPPRRATALVLDGPFAAIFWGKMCSAIGVWMLSLVAVAVVYDETGSAAVVGLVSLGQFAPQLVLAPVAGTWADRGDMPRLIVQGQLMCVAGAAGVAVVVLLDVGTAAVIAGIFVFTLLNGVGLVVSGPAMQAIVPTLIRPGELSIAMALGTFPNNFGRLAGPVTGAVAITLWHPAVAFASAALLHLVLVVVTWIATFPPAAPRVLDAAATSVRSGLRYVRRHRALRRSLLAMLTVAIASEPAITLAPALSRYLSGSDAALGWLSAGFGLGALLGSFAALALPGRVPVRVVAVVGLLQLALGSGLAAVVREEAWAVSCFFLSGVGFALAMAGFSTLIQAHADPEYRGRVMALWLIAFVGARPLAAFLLGLVADLGGLPLAFGCSGVIVASAAWFARPGALGPRAKPV